MTRMRPLSAIAAAALLTLAGCGSTTDNPPAAPAPVTTPAPGPSIDQQKIADLLKDSSIPPAPDAETTAAYLADLERVNPEIVEGSGALSLVNRGRDQCATIKEWPGDEAKWIWWANQRFTSPEHPEGLGEATAARILKVVRKRICPTY
jgi:hypothetical protein